MFSAILVFIGFGCKSGNMKLENETDSLSYVIGLSMGENLYKMDSLINADIVCQAIRDVYNDSRKMTMEEAKTYYMAQKVYFIYEKTKKYQNQFLADLAASEREFVRTNKGTTYKIVKLGKQDIQSMNHRDTVRMVYTLKDDAGNVIKENDTIRCSFKSLISGLQEVVRIAGNNAEFEAWIPSSEGYGVDGNEKLGVKPNQLLFYDVSLLEIKFYDSKNRR